MPSTVVTGGQYGDEGKGKIVDFYAKRADVVVRFQGGANAGHTVAFGGQKFFLHLIPSGVFFGKRVLIGNGVVVDPKAMLEEIAMLEGRGVRVDLGLSSRAHIVMPYHKMLDGAADRKRGSAIGTTLRGIGPAYADKIARDGLRVSDIVDEAMLKRKVGEASGLKQALLGTYGSSETIDAAAIAAEYSGYGKQLAKYVTDTAREINAALDSGKSVLFEGAQGTMLDVDHGTYPYCTSSNTTAGGACTGSGVSPRRIDSVVGVLKAYITRVGGGPMPTELGDETGNYIREKGGEYGTTTGRPRRCGWFDGVIAGYSAMINRFDLIALTKLDVLTGLKRLKVCTAYELDGQRITTMPDAAGLARCKPVYEELDGWNELGVGDIPEAAHRYIKRIGELCKAPVKLVGVGPGREETVEL